MKTKLLAMMLLAGSSMFAAPRFSVGAGIGGFGVGFNQSPPVYASNIPPCPGPGYTWIDGYWANGGWIAGYWSAPPAFTYQVAPRFDNHFVGRDAVRFGDRIGNRDDNRFGDRDDRQSFARAPQQDRGRSFDQNQSHANDNRSNGRDNRQGR